MPNKSDQVSQTADTEQQSCLLLLPEKALGVGHGRTAAEWFRPLQVFGELLTRSSAC